MGNCQLLQRDGYMKYLAVVLSSVMLVACGGGGSSPAVAIDPNLTVPLQKAMANLVNNGMNKRFTLTGSVDNSTQANPVPLAAITGSGTLTLGVPSAATFNGASVLQATEVITGSATANGQTVPIASSGTVYYDPSNYTTVGTVAGSATTVNSAYIYPATVKVGSTGSLGNGSTSGGAISTSTATAYTVASDTATSLLVRIIQGTTSFLSDTTTSQTVYRIDASGGISLVSIEVQQGFLSKIYKILTYTF